VEHDHGFRTVHGYDPKQLRTEIIPPREGKRVSATVLDASELPHAGLDINGVHAILAYHRVYV